MRKSLRKQQIQRTVLSQGADVLSSQGHKKCEKYIQHGDTSVREHTISVACMCVNLVSAITAHTKAPNIYLILINAIIVAL